MTSMKDECVDFCGPYKGYCGKAQYDHDADIFHGEVVGTRDVVTFQGSTPSGLRAAFRESVDDYLKYCRERNERPEKPCSGKFVARIKPEIHRKISTMAELSGKSLNQFVCDCLELIADTAPASSPPSARARRSSGPAKRCSSRACEEKPAARRRRLGRHACVTKHSEPRVASGLAVW